jgi:hypothetical protein
MYNATATNARRALDVAPLKASEKFGQGLAAFFSDLKAQATVESNVVIF